MDVREAIRLLIDGQGLGRADMRAVMHQIMTGEASESQIAGFLVALRIKGETVDEIAGAAEVMRALATPVSTALDDLVDIVGTGGDSAGSFNISTASAFVVAAGGGHVAKHGNRSVSSKSGSADVLEALGINIDIEPGQIARCIEEVGVGFMFAPRHHAAMRNAIVPRRELAVRTVFNLLGPLTNPAGAGRMLLGVFDAAWLRSIAEVCAALGCEHVLVVHSDDGMDEISISAATQVAEMRGGQVTEYRLAPEDFGLARADKAAICVADSHESAAVIGRIFAGERGAPRDIVQLNAGAALYAAGRATSLAEGVAAAGRIIDSGEPARRIAALATLTKGFQ